MRRASTELSDVERSFALALTHDYLTTRGGAERVVLTLAEAFQGAPLYVSLFAPSLTFPEFVDVDVRPLPLNRIAAFRRSYRRALPFLALSFSALAVDADVVICSSSGWSHGVRTTGRKIVYCHSPARWLYQRDRYLRGRGLMARAGLRMLAPALRRWDKRAMRSADCVFVNSTWARTHFEKIYGINAEVLHPPVVVDTGAPVLPVDELEPGFVLCVSRLLPYKNVDAVVAAFTALPHLTLVVAGDGPDRARIASTAPPNVRLLGEVTDEELRWLYASSVGLVAASYEDFGLTPVEAATFGKPTAALRFGGFLDSVVEGQTGLFFDRPAADEIASAVVALLATTWDSALIRAHAEEFGPARFIRVLQDAVANLA